MKKSVITESQIVAAIKEHESGKKVADICRDLSVHQGNFIIGKRNIPVWRARIFTG
jgi:putative transposase